MNDILPYTSWEDWKAGMYRDLSKHDFDAKVSLSASLLADHMRLTMAMRSVVMYWENACNANLRESPNNRSWLGQAACCYAVGATEAATRHAWGLLTDPQRDLANKIADEIIDDWKSTQKKNRQRRLFDA